MNDPIEKKVFNWDSNNGPHISTKYSDINRQIIYLSTRLFRDYELSLGPTSNFFTKLNNWIENVSDESDQQLMFELVPKIFYIGREEMNVLYREAYITQYATWLIDEIEISLLDNNISDILNKETENTWFCPLTDSLRINQFYHINNVPARHDYRPDWRCLVQFGDTTKLIKYIQDNNIKRIVLLEDFIGNGGQVSKAVQFAIDNLKEIPILIIPLVICPAGMKNSLTLEISHSNLKVRPVLMLPQDYFISHIVKHNASEFYKQLNKLAVKTYKKVSNSDIIDDETDPYGPFGWRKTGGLVIMHTNTPNNTLPLIHYKSDTWEPLFNRHKRI